jgi:hypothetical protein
MRVKIPGDLAFYICGFHDDKDYELLVRFSPRKKKKALKKEMAKIVVDMIHEKSKEILEAAELRYGKNER